MTRWAATAAAATATTLLLCGGRPCHAFLASGRVVFAPQETYRNNRCSSNRVTTMSTDGVGLSTTAVVAEVDDSRSGETHSSDVAADASTPSNTSATGTETRPKERNTKDAAADSGRRWIKELKAGDKVIGYVSGTTKFAAFVDCSVVRRGAKGKIMPVTGFLHMTDIKPPYALEGTPRAKECEVEVKRGMHLTAYVKDVLPNAGRITLSLNPKMNKDKVLKLRNSKRQRSRTNRRGRLHKKGGRHAVGDVVEGYVREVRDSMLLVDVMFAELSVLRASKIRNSEDGGKFVNLAEKAKPGDAITVRIEAIETSNRWGAEDDKAMIDFVGWGGLGTAGENSPTEGNGPSAAGQEPFDIGAEIDALPVQEPGTGVSASAEAEEAHGEKQEELQQPPAEQAP